MAKFLYTARSAGGESKGGEITAQDERAVAQQLRSKGILVTSNRKIEEKQAGIKVGFLDRFKTVPLKEKMIFARNLAVMIASGLTISRALNNLTSQTKNKNFQKILQDVYKELQEGKTLSEGLAQISQL